MTFLNAAMLLGLLAMGLPVLVHLLHRKRYEVVEWAATQFLPQQRTTARSRLEFDHIALMILRMIVIAMIVLAFAAPRLSSRWSKITSASAPRDVVIIIDNSASMSRVHDGKSVHDRALARVRSFAESMDSGDRVAVITTRQKSQKTKANLSDRGQIDAMLESLDPPTGLPDWTGAINRANDLLNATDRQREIVILTDGQKFGWADEQTLQNWELLAQNPGVKDGSISVINLATQFPTAIANAWLEPIRVDHAVATTGRELQFQSRVRWVNKKPDTIEVLIDGKLQQSIELKEVDEPGVEISIKQKFEPGSHLVTFQLPPDDLNADNRQDYAIEILPRIPVLLVYGQAANGLDRVGFLRQALAPARDPSPSFAIREMPSSAWSSRWFEEDIDGPNTSPRVVVLDDIEKLTAEQVKQVEQYLQHGGSVLVLAGPHCETGSWNRLAHRNGQGFFPLRFHEVAKVEPALKLRVESFNHLAVSLFRTPLPGGLQTATFQQYWKWLPVDRDTRSVTTVAEFANRDPFLVESSFGQGRVIVSAIPFEDAWRTNLFRLPDFVRLCHELMFSLVGSTVNDQNLSTGQVILYTPNPSELPGSVRIVRPDGTAITQAAGQWPLVLDEYAEPSGYRITSPAGRVRYYTIRPDLRESDLASAAEELTQVTAIMKGMTYRKATDEIPRTQSTTQRTPELWWLALLGVLGLLFMELRYAQRLTQRGDHHLGN